LLFYDKPVRAGFGEDRRRLVADGRGWPPEPPLPFGPELDSRLLDLGPHLEAGADFLSFLDEICE
jgi:hypothetical protein